MYAYFIRSSTPCLKPKFSLQSLQNTLLNWLLLKWYLPEVHTATPTHAPTCPLVTQFLDQCKFMQLKKVIKTHAHCGRTNFILIFCSDLASAGAMHHFINISTSI